MKSISDISVIVCDEITNAIGIVSTNVTNTKPTNVTSTVPLKSNDEKLRYEMECLILHTILLVITLLFIIAIICYHNTKYSSKQNVLAH